MKVPKAISILSKEILRENGEREKVLQAMCRLKHMSRSAVLMRFGDPATWLTN